MGPGEQVSVLPCFSIIIQARLYRLSSENIVYDLPWCVYQSECV